LGNHINKEYINKELKIRLETLKQAKDFKKVYKEGIHINNEYFRISARVIDDHTCTVRLGYAISKKVGNAVVRNRIKRYLREIFRKLPKYNNKSIDFILMIKQPVVALGFHDLENQIHSSIREYLS